MCHGSQIPKLNLLTHILTPGIKGRDHDCSTLAEPIMVFKVAAPIGGHSPIATSDRGYSLPSKQASSPTSYGEKVETDCMQVIREHITKQGISAEAAQIILKSWRKGTCKQYQSFYKKWLDFC